ncbi:MAG: ATP-binding protein [Xanthomonadales bacterium]|nr:ATP-binding protein [Xanthomonadales bacterium]MDZ4116689.1 ATP-binding protein [Xanthomonadaceae bacterium]MDZ4376581.1 ATP-binding protein [Xanthomonadaceae bacterium]
MSEPTPVAGVHAQPVIDNEEALRRWVHDALEVSVSLVGMQAGIKGATFEDELLAATRQHIARLFAFDAMDIVLVDESSGGFEFADSGDQQSVRALKQELDRRVDDGHFAWALRQTRAVVLPTLAGKGSLLLCALGTRNRVRGMFAGLYVAGAAGLSETKLNLLLLILSGVANVLESTALYRLIKQQNVELEERVVLRTRELEVARREADAANHAKSAFLANMSHEIRTPLTAIIGYAELLASGVVPAQQRQSAINTIAGAGRHLLELVSAVLDMSKVESGQLLAESIALDLPQLIADVAGIVTPQMQAKGIDFALECIAPMPGMIESDPLRLRQILLNLLGNAIKFTDQGVVGLRVRVNENGDRLVFEVSDSGIGISAEQAQALFQPFAQADASVSRRFGGTGLGLYLSRQFAERLGGTLELDPAYLAGALFRVTIPLRRVAEHDDLPVPVSGIARGPLRGNVLLADDTAELRELVALYISAIAPDVRVVSVENGARAVEQALTDDFDLIIMDLQMPEMDGFSAAQLLRASGYRGPLIALTANALSEDRDRCLAAGFDAFITKPIDAKVLAEALHTCLSSTGADDDMIAWADMPELKALKLRFVDSLAARCNAMDAASALGDWHGVAGIAHQLKGSGGNFGFPELTACAGALEQAARGSDGPTAARLLAELGTMIESIVDDAGMASARNG